MEKFSIDFLKFSRWIGVFLLMLTFALAIPSFAGKENVLTSKDSHAASGDPNAAPVEQAPVFTSKVATSQQSDGAQSTAPMPEVRIGKFVPGGDVGDAVVEQRPDISPIWARLEALGHGDKANAVIELEVGNGVPASASQAIENGAYLWNSGAFDQAIKVIRSLEESGTGLAVGISWKSPKAVISPNWTDTDVRIGARTEIKETHLDFDAQNGNQFAVLRYRNGSTTAWYWSVNISTDGQTWQETYQWSSTNEIRDVSAAVVDDYLWVGYLGGDADSHEGRMRRLLVSDGSIDSGHGWKTIIDKNVPINEIAVVTNADDFDDRVYYYAILDQSAPLVTAEAAEAPAASNTEAYAAAQQAPIEMGDPDKVITQLAESPKLNFPEEILDDFRKGQTTTRVIVNLRDSEQTPTRAVRPNFQDLAVREGVKQLVRTAQNEVIDLMDQNEVHITNLFTYIFGFSAEVTVQGLVSLVNHPDVVSINEDRILHPHLAQGIPLMNATAARNSYNGAGMAIAICDTGIDYTHARLGNGSFPNSKVIGGYDTGENDIDPMDEQGHGTSCAGIAAGDLGTVGDYIGGVAYNAKLYALKMSRADIGHSAYTADMVEAWEWCITHRNDNPSNPIMIISTSFGGGYYTSESSCDLYSSAMTTAAANAKAAGMTLFVSTGNDGFCDGTGWPGCLSDVVGVGAVYDADIGQNPDPGYVGCIATESCAGYTTNCPCPEKCYIDYTTAADQVPTYSSSASFMELFAPSNDAYTTALGGGYRPDFGGTSAACPYAAGAGAALQSAAMANTGAYLTPDQVQSTLIDNGDSVTDSKVSITKPRVNLGNAVAAVITDNLVFYWASDVNTTTPVWTEFGTGVSNASRGLDATWNDGFSNYFLHVSYIASDGTNDPVMVLRTNGVAMEAIEVLSNFTGWLGRTSVSAYSDTVICTYEHSFANGNGIQYNISYNGGDSWSVGWWEPDAGHRFSNPDVTCRGGQGSAMIYDDYAGLSFDPVWFRYRDHYSAGAWDAEVAQINDKDSATAWPNRIEWLPPLSGHTYAYGTIYISWDPDTGTPYFDRSDDRKASFPAAAINLLLLGE